MGKNQPNLDLNKSDDEKSSILQDIKVKVHRKLIELLDLNEARRIPIEELHKECSQRIDALIAEQQYPLSGPEKEKLLHEVMDEVFGFGPLEPF
ncbi:MAG: hypothetical protein ACYTEE_07210 [Planctomycetota bacterium]